ncbi:Stk1 family PASTA domain-containing Ser/Thr kinase [Actinacidiphila reveromycinica]|uniref:Stk1 family PASTA domain-containing Ser/Thr kinase n=1 Tax=Actinacidiphila reveromycinica TaxID=659352 RepID=UPI001920CA35|nr:Stk1 family PASTA domain-containing Ser/Thr kinase [Streptomyces sp. SN-593]
MDTSVQDPLVGQVLDGRYLVEGRIAVGGMATVYRATDTRLDRELALKVMHPSLADDAVFVERFIREAKAVAKLAHPNVVGVFDQGTDGTYVYLAMEYVAGCTLRDVLRERGALQVHAALDILEPVLAALGAAHRAGLVHRDMKPENVLIGDDGRVKVADFGLVRVIDTKTSASTGAVLGTVSYLAPEQIGHGTVDQRADVYACGVVLYEMLAGRKPYDGDTPVKVMYQHVNEDVPAPSAAVPTVPPLLDALVARACARPQQERPADAVELLAEVRTARAALSAEELDALPGGPAARPSGPVAVPGAEPSDTVPAAGTTGTAGTAGTPPPGSEEPTSVVALPEDALTDRTARLMPPAPAPDDPPAAPAAGWFRSRRGPLAVLVALLVVLGVGAGVWYINDGQFTTVPGVLSLPQAKAEQKLDRAGLDSKVKQGFSLTVPRGSVIATDPSPGRRIRGNGTVTLTVSKGPQHVRVPDVAGRDLATARKEIKEASLVPSTVTESFSDDVPRGRVVATDPAGTTQLDPGTRVAITVSRGRPVDVPDVVGESVTDAQQDLEAAGLKVVLAPGKVFSDVADKDKVALVSPGKGSQVARGDSVTITVSKGQQQFPVPDVTGKSSGDAKKILQAAGFDVRVINVFFGSTVFSQSPDGGSQAPKGATITLWVR